MSNFYTQMSEGVLGVQHMADPLWLPETVAAMTLAPRISPRQRQRWAQMGSDEARRKVGPFES